jgi:acyl-CoA dehydrogenase
MWTTGLHKASHVLVFARHTGKDGSPHGIGCFVVPTEASGFQIGDYLWTFNMPTDHPQCTLNEVFVTDEDVLGDVDQGLKVAMHFVHESRIRQAASSLGAAQYCLNETFAYTKERAPFGKPLSTNQGIQFPRLGNGWLQNGTSRTYAISSQAGVAHTNRRARRYPTFF